MWSNEKCTCNMMKKLADAESLNKLIQFLMALNEGFENIRGSILAMEPLPPVNRAFHLVQQQEKQKEITGNMSINTEVSAMNVKRQPTNNWQKRESKEAKMKKKCDHCLMKGHTKEECFELVRYPDWFKNPPKGKSKKVAANVNKQNAEPASETPLDKNFEHGECSGTKPDPSLISTMVQEVMKAMSEKQHLANFAGNLLATNVGHYFQVFDPGSWIVDSGASDHMVGNKGLLTEIRSLKFPRKVGLPDGQVKNVKEIGSVKLTDNIVLKNVLLLPDFKHNLMSVRKLIEDGICIVNFDKNGCLIQDPTSKRVIAEGRSEEGIYRLNFGQNEKKSRSNGKCSVNNVSRKENLSILHARLGHVYLSKMKHLSFCGCKNLSEYFCDTCCVAKHHRMPLKPSNTIASRIFELIHIDLWGPYKVKNVTGASYFLTIVDDYSRATWTQLLSNKEQVKGILNNFLNFVENHYECKVKTLRSDNETEIFQSECGKVLAERGILHQRSIPGVPQQNGRVERKHRFLLETARAIRLHAGLPGYFWGECILSATYLINLLPSSVLGWKTPFERLNKRKPEYDHLRIIGCLCYGLPTVKKSDKFGEKGIRSVLIGYLYGQKGYKLFDLEKRKIYMCRDVKFEERIFPFLNKKEPVLQNLYKQVFLPDINSEDQERNDEGGGDNSLIEESLETLELFDASEFVHMDSETSEQIFHNDESAAVEQEVATQSMPIQEENAEPKETRKSERERTVSKKLKDYIYKIPGMTGQSDESGAFTVHTHGYIQSKKDYSLFTKEENGKQAIILAYVDDLLITSDNLEEIERVKKNLDKEFTIKDLGELRFFVGIEIDRNENGIILNQRKYILDILKNNGIEYCKVAKFPFPKGMKLSTDSGEVLQEPEIYRRIIGKLLYLNITRLDISYSVQQLSQFMQCPRKPHLQAAIHVMRYLKGTMDWGFGSISLVTVVSLVYFL
uniref:Integrase catalytic domain-containing protein n=1 Tax=Chenopodium quinoa TaxID=63459 RepID=A0A803LBA1_CHEQI